ncbi:copper resistance CopC family protein [Sporosarcina sp. A2]|uniref:copper resistance CopC family protein n=1 Tax=Sporosarcina sp. A2 TaxID=3393449 RepID=UPI003D7A269C
MKRIICATLILFFAFTTTVSAHTGLTSSSPAGGEDITEDVYEIVLEFNSKIESTSTVKVFDESKEEIIISTTQVSGDMMTGGFLSPLDKGTYAVEWKIIGTDGHPIQGTYSFMVSQFEEPVVTEEKQEMSVVPKKESNRRTCRAVNRRFIKISIE